MNDLASRMIGVGVWRPISELPDNGVGHREHGLNMLLHAPELVHADCNPHGIAEGHWQDGGKGGDTEPGAFISPRWCMDHDEYHLVEVSPTHFMYVDAPPQSEAVSGYERYLAAESRGISPHYTHVNSGQFVCAACGERWGFEQSFPSSCAPSNEGTRNG